MRRAPRPVALAGAAGAFAAALALAAGASGCAPLNYTHARLPREVTCCAPAPAGAVPETLRVVTYNVAFAREIDRAIHVLTTTPALAGADVVLLQEMDGPGTRRIARALGMNEVYYPAVRHPQSGRDFGNAILTRWPIERVRKTVLPHRGRFGRTQRIAVSAVLRVGARAVGVTSVHLATPVEVAPARRRDQADAVARLWADADIDLAIVGGDLNDPALWRRFAEAGFACPTTEIGPTSDHGFTLDHVVVRRRATAHDAYARAADATLPAGAIPGDGVTSDHFAVWARVPLEPPAAAADRAFARRAPDVPGIANFAWLAPGVARGAQPDAAGFAWLARQGFRTVITFRQHHDEEHRVAPTGMRLIEIPVQADVLGSSRPAAAQLARFFATVRDSAARPVYFHCARGRDRTGMFAALYRMEIDGWTREEAIAEMQAFGYSDFFRDLIATVRGYVPGTPAAATR